MNKKGNHSRIYRVLSILLSVALLTSGLYETSVAISITASKSLMSDDVMIPVTCSTDSQTEYLLPSGIESVSTDSYHPWTCSEDGVLTSGNKGVRSTYSVLKITVKGSGVLRFEYELHTSKASGKDVLMFWKNAHNDVYEPFRGNTGTAISSSKNDERNNLVRKYGDIDEATELISVEADETEKTVFFIVYKKNGSASDDSKIDSVSIKSLSFTSGKISITSAVNDSSLGVVSGETEYIAGERTHFTATAYENGIFCGWNLNGKFLTDSPDCSFVSNEGDVITALFCKKGEDNVRNITTGYVYATVEAALRSAKDADKLMLLKDAVVTSDTVIPEGVTLYVPYDGTYNDIGSVNGTASASVDFAGESKTFRRLTVNQGVRLTVCGVLRVGGILGYPGQYYQGHTSGAHGRIVNNGSVVIASNGVLDCFGYVSGTGNVTAQPGARVYEPFVVYDYAGGSNTMNQYNGGYKNQQENGNAEKRSPFVQYTMQNITCSLTINSGSWLYGKCMLYAGGEFYKTDAVVIGKGDSGLFTLKDGASLVRTIDKQKNCGTYCPDIGRVNYTVTGGASFGSLSMTLLDSVFVTTKGILFPIPFGFSYLLKNGSYEIKSDTVLLPGGEIKVDEDAVLSVSERFFVADGLVQNSLSGKRYPTTETLKASGFSTGGVLTVNGTLELKSGVRFGGIVQTERLGAKIITGNQPNGDKNDYYSTQIVLGADTIYGDNTTRMTVDGRVYTAGKTEKLSPGKTYISYSTDGWTLDSFTIDSYTTGTSVDSIVYHEDKTFTVNNPMRGGFVDESMQNLQGDINGDMKVDCDDLHHVMESLVGICEMSEREIELADLSGDGVIDAYDLSLLADLINGKSPH